ncbi:MAG: hypothetical protein Q6352_015870 [Candidatus Freyrarchaeum guaymaensis]
MSKAHCTVHALMLEADLNRAQKISIAENLLKPAGVEIHLSREKFSVIIREGHVEVVD